MKFLNPYISFILLVCFSLLFSASLWELLNGKKVDGFIPYILILSGLASITFLYFLRKTYNRIDRLIFVRWGLGFIFLFLFNVLIESLILPFLELDHTSKNDLYFQVWWVFVLMWFFFGWIILKRINLK